MPDFRNLVRQRFATMQLTPAAESDLVEEVAQHLEDLYRELRSGGAAEEDAYRRAGAELDDMYPLHAGLDREQRLPRHEAVPAGTPSQSNLVEGVWKDLRYALRSMRKNPVFVIFVVLTLALGIGANTTVFTLINTVVLHPLPVQNSNELMAVAAADSRNTAKSSAFFPISYADLKDYRARNQVFDSLAGFSSARGMTRQDHGATQAIFGELVTDDYFSTLGLIPARGRFFTPEENRVAGGQPVAVLNYAAWQKLFGGAEDITGREIVVNNITFTVIGVAPPHFIGVTAIFGPDLWMPATMAERLFPNSLERALSDRNKAAFLGVGRLRPGVTPAQARANIASIASALAQEFPATNEGHAAAVMPVSDVLLSGNGTSANAMVFASAALLAVVGIVLLIACSNVANLLLARSSARRQEMAVRLAMGASRSRLIRQMLTESVLLALLGGAVGLFVAYGGLQFLFGRLPAAANFPAPLLDGTVLVFAFAVSLATGFLFGLFPALKASRANVAETLKDAGRTAGRSRRRVTVANALLVGQVAFSFLLLVTATLFLRSIGRAYGIDPGFQTAHLAVFPTNPGQAGYGKLRARAYYKDIGERVARMPGIESVSWSSNMPLWARSIAGLKVEGRPQKSAEQIRTVINIIGTDYFETAGVPIENGRGFTAADQEHGLPVAVVNRKMAHDYWQDDALGRRIQLPGETTMRVIVGVARNANYTGWGEAPQLCAYVPMSQNDSEAMVLYVRSKGEPQQMLAAVERELRTAAPQVLVFGIRTGKEVIDGGLFQARMGVGLLSAFGLLALALASIGLYGVLAYSVNQRKREIGLRMALGATRASVLRLILGEGMSLVGLGVAIGFAAALGAGQLLSRMLFGVGASDPLSIAGAALTLAAVALVACYLPARWATRVDPLEAIREP